jgi:hypothetical protein
VWVNPIIFLSFKTTFSRTAAFVRLLGVMTGYE